MFWVRNSILECANLLCGGDDSDRSQTTVTGLAGEGEEKGFVCETEGVGKKRVLGFNSCTTHQFF